MHGTLTTTPVLTIAGYSAVVTVLFLVLSSQAGAFAQGTILQPQQPELKDQQGNPLSNPVAGKLAIISATVVNNNSTSSEPFVAMVEARSATGVTEFLEFQIAQVSQGGSSEFGISWTPEQAGTYELRTFMLSSLEEPEVLSDVQTRQITVENNE